MSDANEEIKRRSSRWCAAYLEAEAERQRLQSENEQLRVQLAGCGVVALGLASGVAKQGDYGWSDSYQRVVELRTKFTALVRAADEMLYNVDHYSDWRGAPNADMFFKMLVKDADKYRKLRFNYDRKLREGDGT